MFRDRREAGHALAAALQSYRGPKTIVIGIPRGGVVVADTVAKDIDARLDIVVPRKIGAPGNPELALGAIASGGIRVLDEGLLQQLHVSSDYLTGEISEQSEEIDRRTQLYRKGLSHLEVTGMTVLLVDDGIATGATTLAAVRYLRKLEPKSIVLAIPVAPHNSIEKLSKDVDHIVVLKSPEIFFAVGQFYEHFEQTTDNEVIDILSVYRSKNI